MIKDCCDKNPLKRDGTSQQQRLLKALLPGYVAVDERSIDDLIAFAGKYAREIQFYNTGDKNDYLTEAEFYDIENHRDGNWEKFFDKLIDEKFQITEPHYALFIAFLKLFKYAQDDLNQLTKKHIDFYYKDVLQLSEKSALADQVYIIFELAKDVLQCLIKKGTKLRAGKDNTGVELVYETDREIVVNQAKVSELKALFNNKNDIFKDISGDKAPSPDNNFCLYSSSVADSSDGKGGEIETGDKSWEAFGLPELTYNAVKGIYDTDRKQADIGFAFASPNLFLSEGDRLVRLTMTFSDGKMLNNILHDKDYDISKTFKVFFSGEKEWIEALEVNADKIAEEKALEFINNAKNPEDIAGTEPQEGPVYDDPATGYGDQRRDYDIGLLVAGRIIALRDSPPPGKKFSSVFELLKVRGFGKDKLNDLRYSFRKNYYDTRIDPDKKQIIIIRTIFKNQPPIVKFNKAVLGDPFETFWPVVKILLNTDEIHGKYIYKDLKELTITNAEISADVTGVKSLILQNDFSALSPAKPFLPFTNRPVLGSNFYIGSWEVFQKKPDYINLKIAWQKLPEDNDGFKGYYENYIDLMDGTARANNSFKISISYLKNKEWICVRGNTSLFTDNNGSVIGDDDPLPVDKTVKIISLDPGIKIERDEKTEQFKVLDETSQRGFMKMELAGVDFGHSSYQLSYTKAVLIGVEKKGTDYTDSLPNEPYTPTIKELSLDYSSSEKISLIKSSEESYENRIEQFFHIHPFGVEEIKTTNHQNFLMPQYDDEGTLFIGIKGLEPPQSLSILFKVSEGSPDPDLPAQMVNWYYLADNNWEKFEKNDILYDSTKSLITSGIISFNISKIATSDNTILTSGLLWIKACVEKKSKAVADLISITSQAATASFKDNNNDPDHLRKPLEAGTIKKLKESNTSISRISQPYTSFGGKIREQDSELYIRISERLRHKTRAITIWDYERLVLQQFPSIYKVKCLNHTKYLESSTDPVKSTKSQNTTGKGLFIETAPGNVTLIVVSNVRNINAVDPLKPKTSLNILTAIKEYIQAICSEIVGLYVMNPAYEEVKVDFKVRFHKQYDAKYYQRQLNSEIKEFLAPWAFDTDSDVIFGGKIHKSKILDYVEKREYVDFVTCFRMSLISDNGDKSTDIEIAEATKSASILTSAKTHSIEVIETDACECENNDQSDINILSRNECACGK